MLYLTPDITRQLVKLHTQELLREADAERLAREATREGQRGTHPSRKGLIVSARAALTVLAAIARLGHHHAPAQVEPTPTVGREGGRSVGTPAAG
jgi:hypothetical protein